MGVMRQRPPVTVALPEDKPSAIPVIRWNSAQEPDGK